jgi:nucleoside-diphosphate-sugar epimerase
MPYSAQKAEVEKELGQALLKTERTAAWIFRPCIVAGPTADTFLRQLPYFQIGERLPDPVRRFLQGMPALRPVIPDAGPSFQLVHEDDVATAFVAGALGRGSPGPYNLAARGRLSLGDVAEALGWYAFPLPDAAVEATAEVITRLPGLPAEFSWLQAARKPVWMRTTRAQKELGWKPKHTARATLKQMIEAYRAEGDHVSD